MKTLKSKLLNLSCVALVVALIFSCGTTTSSTPEFDVDKELAYCEQQVLRAIKALGESGATDYTMMPRNIAKGEVNWTSRKSSEKEWTSGFWPGVLWYAVEASNNNPVIREAAEKFSETLYPIADMPAYDHDLGFLMFCPFGQAHKLTKDPKYTDLILRTSDTLATLFNPVVGTILSWPREVEPHGWPHNTIMDNMINLDMMFWAAKNGGEEHKYLYDLAVSHADVTMNNHFRDDYTSYHVAVYDTISGNLIKGVTHQGYADHTMWARGQAWAIYGFTVVYRETQDPKYLDFVQKVTDVYLKDLPYDAVPFWDFSAPGIPNAPRDASSAAVVASALIELSQYVEPAKGAEYMDYAVKMLTSLSNDYQCGDEKVAFLDHSTGHHPNNSEIDIPIIYADYYYIEALLRLKNMQ